MLKELNCYITKCVICRRDVVVFVAVAVAVTVAVAAIFRRQLIHSSIATRVNYPLSHCCTSTSFCIIKHGTDHATGLIVVSAFERLAAMTMTEEELTALADKRNGMLYESSPPVDAIENAIDDACIAPGNEVRIIGDSEGI
jgi:hypothetical protein